MQQQQPPRTAVVIGAGAAGLVAARELIAVGLSVTILEQAEGVGGQWIYSDVTDADPCGQSGPLAPSALYASLRTNLPRDLMSFVDFPFAVDNADARRFPHHSAVRAYLERFADAYDLNARIRFQRVVEAVHRIDQHGARVAFDTGAQWEVIAHSRAAGEEGSERFVADAVVVCNGHFTVPRVIELPGLSRFAGRVLHSHSYRHARPFAGARVGLIGASASAIDIAEDLSQDAASVHLFADAFAEFDASARSAQGGRLRGLPRQVVAAGVEVAVDLDAAAGGHAGGNVKADAARVDGPMSPAVDSRETIALDVIMFCTGYDFDFPFLRSPLASQSVSVDHNRVDGLCHEIMSIEAPTLAFIGLPFMVLPFPLFAMQARWLARAWVGRVALPSVATMRARLHQDHARRQADGELDRHYHRFGFPRMFAYYEQLARECGEPPMPASVPALLKIIGEARQHSPGRYRDHDYPTLADVALAGAE